VSWINAVLDMDAARISRFFRSTSVSASPHQPGHRRATD
jgi:hypothetical protein